MLILYISIQCTSIMITSIFFHPDLLLACDFTSESVFFRVFLSEIFVHLFQREILLKYKEQNNKSEYRTRPQANKNAFQLSYLTNFQLYLRRFSFYRLINSLRTH